MNLMTKVLKSLFPKTFYLIGDISSFIDAISHVFENARGFLSGVLKESNPSSAVETLPEWYDQLGIAYDPDKDVKELQNMASATFTSISTPTLNEIKAKVTGSFPDISVEEIGEYSDTQVGIAQCGVAFCGSEQFLHHYIIRGKVENEALLEQLKALLTRIVPAHLTPVFIVEVKS